jgi:hypothetical protein
MVESNPDEFKHSKPGAICYNTVVDFAHSGATVLVEIVTSQEKSQASLINIARQAINKTGGFTKSFTQSTEWIPSRIERICRFCKQSFILKKSFAKYCSNACRVKAYQWRHKFTIKSAACPEAGRKPRACPESCCRLAISCACNDCQLC